MFLKSLDGQQLPGNVIKKQWNLALKTRRQEIADEIMLAELGAIQESQNYLIINIFVKPTIWLDNLTFRLKIVKA